MGRALFTVGGLLLLVSLAAAGSSAAEEGKTIFGGNRRETIQAMKEIVKALGVKNCQHCHVKQGGRPRFDLETPTKKIARQMKLGFVDSLAHAGHVALTIAKEDHETTVTALYRDEGDSAGIELAILVEGEKARTAVVPLPEGGPCRLRHLSSGSAAHSPAPGGIGHG